MRPPLLFDDVSNAFRDHALTDQVGVNHVVKPFRLDEVAQVDEARAMCRALARQQVGVSLRQRRQASAELRPGVAR